MIITLIKIFAEQENIKVKIQVERKWKQMKKIDKNKVYAFIGRAVVYSSLYIATVAGTIWAFLECTTVYR